MGFHCLTSHAFDFGKASVLLDDRFPHTHGARKGSQTIGLYGINVDQALHFSVIAVAVMVFVRCQMSMFMTASI